MEPSSNSSSEPQPANEAAAPQRGVARVVITPEEALLVPESALQPEKQLRLAPSKETPISVRAIVSFVLGILGAPLVGVLTGWFAIWFGTLALRQIDGPERFRGRGLAMSGIALGVFDILLWLVLIMIYAHSLSQRLGHVAAAIN